MYELELELAPACLLLLQTGSAFLFPSALSKVSRIWRGLVSREWGASSSRTASAPFLVTSTAIDFSPTNKFQSRPQAGPALTHSHSLSSSHPSRGE